MTYLARRPLRTRFSKKGWSCACAVSAIALVGSGACDLVISLPKEPESIITALCRCEDEVPFFTDRDGNAVECEAYVEGRLAEDPTVSAGWLELFEAARCDQCKRSGACTSVAPLCRELGQTCATGRNETCCGFDPEDPAAVYCFSVPGGESTCIARDSQCLPTGSKCSVTDDPSPCCGACLTVSPTALIGQCVNVCQVDNDVACPGCCARVDSGGDTFGLCIDVVFDDVSLCDTLSCSDEDGCPIGTACVPHLVIEGEDPTQDVIVYYCSAPVGS